MWCGSPQSQGCEISPEEEGQRCKDYLTCLIIFKYLISYNPYLGRKCHLFKFDFTYMLLNSKRNSRQLRNLRKIFNNKYSHRRVAA
jgi:hypothetical protein